MKTKVKLTEMKSIINSFSLYRNHALVSLARLYTLAQWQVLATHSTFSKQKQTDKKATRQRKGKV